MGKYTVNNNFPKCNIWITVLAQNAFSLWDGSANPDEFPQLALATDWGFAAAQANKKGGKWLIAIPKEGKTAWIDYWCITKAVKG